MQRKKQFGGFLMRLYLLTAAQERRGDPPLPVMVIIAMLLLMLPYLIRVKTGRSITEWLVIIS